jgi:outer membrane protein
MKIWIAIAAVLAPRVAAAAPSLGDFLAAAHQADLDVREQGSLVEERAAASRVEGGALWPRLSATADYLHNQHEVVVTIPRGAEPPLQATIQPFDQVDATFQLDVPLLDLAQRRRAAAARLDEDAARATRDATTVGVDRQVVSAYYQWVGGTALRVSSEAAAKTAADNLAVLESRLAAGLTRDLDVARARAQLARAQQSIADADLAVASARRTLRTLTGLEPSGDAPPLPADTAPEAPLEAWLAAVDRAPEVAAARTTADAATARAEADRWGFAPTVGGFARERLTNAAGFGDVSTWAVGVTATWTLDRRTFARADASRAGRVTAEIRAARAAQQVHDRIVDAWDQVEALRARVGAAAAQAAADREALAVAQVREKGGQATPLDVAIAERDALESDVALIQEEADLAAARALLRLAANQEPR